MSETSKGIFEKSAEKIAKTAAILGLLALGGSVLIPALTQTAAKAGLVWAGAEFARNHYRK